MGSHSWWLQQLFYMQWLLKSASLYVVLCSEEKKIWTYHPHLKFNQEAILPFSWCIMCVGRDSLRQVNSFLEVLRGPLGTKAPFPFWEVEHFPLHMYWQLYMNMEYMENTKHYGSSQQALPPFGHLSSFCMLGRLFESRPPLSHDRKGRR